VDNAKPLTMPNAGVDDTHTNGKQKKGISKYTGGLPRLCKIKIDLKKIFLQNQFLKIFQMNLFKMSQGEMIEFVFLLHCLQIRIHEMEANMDLQRCEIW
jgi:hypothetical protein